MKKLFQAATFLLFLTSCSSESPEEALKREQFNVCRGKVILTLKDPTSIHTLAYVKDINKDKNAVILYTYTATNSFGGRIQESVGCIFEKDTTTLKKFIN